MAKIKEPNLEEYARAKEPWKLLEEPLSQYFAELAEENGLEVRKNQRPPYETPVSLREAYDPKSKTRLYLRLLLGKATEHYLSLEFNPPFSTRSLIDVLNDLGVEQCTINGSPHQIRDGSIVSEKIDTKNLGFGTTDFNSEKIEQFCGYLPSLLRLVRRK